MKRELETAIAAAVKDLFDIDVTVELTRPEEKFGDYATNVALQLAQKTGKNPREVAESLADNVRTALADTISDISVAGPGFINMKLTDAALRQAAETAPAKALTDLTVVIETNNPNPFKAMHIGHALNAILGDTVANLIKAGGAHLYRVSYHGDVGLHVGKSMYSLLKFVDGDPNKLQTVKPAGRNSFMSRMYAEGSAAYDEDAVAKAEIDKLAEQSFSREDRLYAEVYDMCKQWSFDQIDDTVKRLGNKPVERRFLESEADERGIKVVRDHVPAVFQESQGALIFPGSKYGSFDNVFVSAKGRGLYGARDLGLIQLKNEQYHPQKSYIVTAEEQRDYFRGVIIAAELCMPELKGVTVNIPTGMVRLPSGKISSRTGDVVEISWLFDQVTASVAARGGQATDEIAAGALRYEFLKVRIGNDIIFDIDEAVSLQGNSGPYLQYAHARAKSILAKAGEVSTPGEMTLEADERSLLRKISGYPEIVDQAVAELLPHHICTYLYELAQTFNRFYENNRVIGDDRQNVRLALVEHYAGTLKSGLNLLGIAAPDKM